MTETATTEQAKERRRRARLRKSNPLGKGYRRVRSGSGFSFKDPDGNTVRDPELRARFDALGIPPAWRDVWIAPYDNGHIQAVGYDAANRKQYIYHPTWRQRNDKKKFERMLLLAEALPHARRQVTRHLRDEGITRRRVLAAAFRMLDAGGLRIGSSRYEEENGSYGLTTLHGEHAHVDGKRVRLTFPAKSHKVWDSTIKDADLAELIRELQERRGPDERLLAYEQDGQWHPITPQDVNRLREAAHRRVLLRQGLPHPARHRDRRLEPRAARAGAGEVEAEAGHRRRRCATPPRCSRTPRRSPRRATSIRGSWTASGRARPSIPSGRSRASRRC